MRVLVLGAAGYVGTTLCNQLVKYVDDVIAVDNLYRGNADALIPLCAHDNFSFMFGDITNEESIKRVVPEADCIILLAALVGAPICQKFPTLSKAVTVGGAKNVIKYKRKDSVLFFASTGSVYGKLDEICTEESPTNPQSIYGQHKLEAEKIILDAENTYVYRFATAFGVSPCMRVNLLINDLVIRAYNEKSLVIFQADFKRTFIHIIDMAYSFLYGIQNHYRFKHRLYNVGAFDGNWTKREIAEKIKEIIPCTIFYEDIAKDIDQRNYAVSYDKIKEAGWPCARNSIPGGIKELIKSAPLINLQGKYA